MESKQRSLVAPLIYSDIFSYPLTLSEICRFALTPITEPEAKRVLATLYPSVMEDRGYYALKGRGTIVSRRLRSVAQLKQKYEDLMPIVRILSRIPTVYCIGLSGSLAAGSVTSQADSDLFIITKKNTLFLSRLLLLVFLQVLGRRRRKHTRHARNTICLNMLIDEDALAFTDEKRDLYIAREITQLVPLYDKKKTYQRFLNKNDWVKRIFPNAKPHAVKLTAKKATNGLLEWLLSRSAVEKSLRFIELQYMRSSRTNETITPHVLAFHPNDHRLKTIKLYQKKMKAFEANFVMKKRKTMIQLPVIDKEKNIFYTA